MKATHYRTLILLCNQLEGERVMMRSYRASDARALYEAVEESREHLRPWLPFADETFEEASDWVIRQQAAWLLRENLSLGIWEQSSGHFLGSAGLIPSNWQIGYFGIGYWLRASAEGHGYMSEAVSLLVDYAFSELGAERLEIQCDERNERSAAVARRLGFKREGCRRNDFCASDGSLRNTLIFGLLPTDRS
ncbi:GNAT family N-acetyltransferase [Ktedonobacter racemifer]|uniref:GCN5-related N-acetyltransferase n=1 Tax=Ktedonobacter racemifer DSM 44963 TaxID=485913 RepID=D6TUW1_KTERA|nr:GNAT family N-acetyltransferase [Ktedonobacter racemifer]EFH85287.1 GCN5-related N-acetyltransferase [Ktedonobacter racemifer DSM 44963]